MKQNELMVVNGYEIRGTELKSYTKKIIKLGDEIKSNYLKMGSLFIEVRDKGLLKDEGLSLVEYSEKLFGISRSTLYRMMAMVEKVYQPLLAMKIEAELDNEKDVINTLLELPDVAMAKLAEYDSIEDLVKILANKSYDERDEIFFSTRNVRKFIDNLNKMKDESNEIIEKKTEDNKSGKKEEENKLEKIIDDEKNIANSIIENGDYNKPIENSDYNKPIENGLNEDAFADDVYNTLHAVLIDLRREREAVTELELRVQTVIETFIERWYED